MKNQKTLVKVTLILLALIVAATIFQARHVYHSTEITDTTSGTMTVDTSDQPVLGQATAPVYVVAFESLECSHCQRYMETIFPEFKKQYIDTGKVKYTPILISYSHYDVAGQAAYCALKQGSSAYFAFLDQAYLNQPHAPFWTITSLLDVAKSVPSFDVQALQSCIENSEFAEQMEKNIAMLDELKIKGVPTILVNGIPLEEVSQESLFQLIDNQLAQSIKEVTK
jgi:protein-disulfide isomerase